MIFHIALRTDWEAARSVGRYEGSTRGRSLADQGFVHCSLSSQVRGVAEAFYADLDDLVLLVIDPARLGVPVRYEQGFPHVYGAIPVHAVLSAEPITRDADGRFVLPV